MARPTDIFQETQATASRRANHTWLRRLEKALLADARLWFGVILLLFVLAALFAPFITPYSPNAYNSSIATQGPTLAHPLGTDDLGRDLLSRIIYGTRISLSVGLATILLGGIVGTMLGIIAAYWKGWVDQIITIVTDAILSFPSLILALAIVTALGASIVNLILALAVVRIPLYARIARGQALQVAAQEYVIASIANGTPTWKIILRHLLPNTFSPLLVQAAISISFAILDESILSFLGLGVQPPTPEWGLMVNEAQTYIRSDPWMMLVPSLAIVIVVLSFNIVGDAIRDHLDPRDMTHVAVPSQERVS